MQDTGGGGGRVSLVHEALQKAEREKQRKAGAPPTTVAVAPVPKQTAAVALPTTHARWPAAWIAGTLALIVVAGIVALVFHGRTPLQPATSAAVVEKPAPASPPPAPPSSPAAIPAPATFSLTGIMKDPGGQYCAVLNGRVVYEGHVVEGATVKSIDRDRVTMEQNDRETVLRLF